MQLCCGILYLISVLLKSSLNFNIFGLHSCVFVSLLSTSVCAQDTLREHNILAWDKGSWVLSWSRLEAYWQGLRERANKVKEREEAMRKAGKEPPKRINVRGAIAEKIHWTPWQPAQITQVIKRRRIDDGGDGQ